MTSPNDPPIYMVKECVGGTPLPQQTPPERHPFHTIDHMFLFLNINDHLLAGHPWGPGLLRFILKFFSSDFNLFILSVSYFFSYHFLFSFSTFFYWFPFNFYSGFNFSSSLYLCSFSLLFFPYLFFFWFFFPPCINKHSSYFKKWVATLSVY